tara:strand:- start:4663 stop:5856 length:1194 start_codon:yes stop_codon:yes gene_type:complete
MAGTTAYPAALDNNTNLDDTLADNVDTVAAAHQNNQSAAIKAMQSKVGVTASTATTTKVLVGGASAGTSAWCTISGDATISNSGVVTVSSISGTAVYINETANAKSTIGLTINQAANDNEILAFKSTDVDHGLTTLGSEADTYAAFQKTSAAYGGLQITSIADDDALASPTVIKSFGGTATTTKTDTGVGLIDLYAAEHDGADTVGNITADGNIFSVRAKTGGADKTKFLVDEDGDAYIFGAATVTGTVTAGGTVLSGVTATPALTDINGTANRAMYVNGSGDVTEIALGAAGTVLAGNGTSAAPAFENITATDINGGTWKVFYTNAGGDVIEVALGADGTVLQSNGGAVAPTFESAAGGDDMIVGRSFGLRQNTNPASVQFSSIHGVWYYAESWYN